MSIYLLTEQSPQALRARALRGHVRHGGVDARNLTGHASEIRLDLVKHRVRRRVPQAAHCAEVFGVELQSTKIGKAKYVLGPS